MAHFSVVPEMQQKTHVARAARWQAASSKKAPLLSLFRPRWTPVCQTDLLSLATHLLREIYLGGGKKKINKKNKGLLSD